MKKISQDSLVITLCPLYLYCLFSENAQFQNKVFSSYGPVRSLGRSELIFLKSIGGEIRNPENQGSNKSRFDFSQMSFRSEVAYKKEIMVGMTIQILVPTGG